jgi:hypothetical protein
MACHEQASGASNGCLAWIREGYPCYVRCCLPIPTVCTYLLIAWRRFRPKSSQNVKRRISATYHPGEEIVFSLRHSLISLPYGNSPTRAPLVTSLLSASNLAALFIAGTFCDIATIRNVCQCRIRYEGPLLRIGKVYLPGQFCSRRA